MTIADRRALLAATQALVQTNRPDADHYNALLAALGAVASADFGAPLAAALLPTHNQNNVTQPRSV